MNIAIEITNAPIELNLQCPPEICGTAGAWVEFRGVVRGEESGSQISALEYEAYETMAISVIRKIVESLGQTNPVVYFHAIHRIGIVPVGEAAIYVGVAAKHRGSAFVVLSGFMDRLKQDVPIWKTRAIETQSLNKPAGALVSAPLA